MILKWLAAGYKLLWSRFGGRPWTWISRASWIASPARWAFGLVAGGILAGWLARRYLGWKGSLALLVGFVVGFILGHIYWT